MNKAHISKGDRVKIEDKVFKLLVLLILIIIVFSLWKISDIFIGKKTFYEYRGTKINLLQVHKIEPKISYRISSPDDNFENINKQYNVQFNTNEINKIVKLLKVISSKSYYNIEIIAYMIFDKRQIELYRSKHYIKYPQYYSVNEYLLETLRAYGIDDFQYNSLLKIKGIKYKSRNKFIEEVVSYGKLKRGRWSDTEIPRLGLNRKGDRFVQTLEDNLQENILTQKDRTSIIEGLEDAYKAYLGIQ